MIISLKEIPIREVVAGYQNNNEEGVIGYKGRLNIRPKYQREFVYKDKQRDSVIETITRNFPLNVMYWVKNGDSYEVLDGQQRTISFCEYIVGKFSMNIYGGTFYFHNLEESMPDKAEAILDYRLMVYFCEGTDSERLDWFKIINIAGEELTDQELRNAIYTGEWLTDAKKYFSKTGCPAYQIASEYLNGVAIRQDYLQTALRWISNDKIEYYMAKAQHSSNASELWQYFQQVINWTKVIFPNYRKEMKGVEWGLLYNEFKDKRINAADFENKIVELMLDEDVTKKSGIYTYLLTGKEKYLSIRAFTDKMKREAFERQRGTCPDCGKSYDMKEMDGHHRDKWVDGGKTETDNCLMLCKTCHKKRHTY